MNGQIMTGMFEQRLKYKVNVVILPSFSSDICLGGITLRSGRRGFAIYKDGKVIEQYTVIGRLVKIER